MRGGGKRLSHLVGAPCVKYGCSIANFCPMYAIIKTAASVSSNWIITVLKYIYNCWQHSPTHWSPQRASRFHELYFSYHPHTCGDKIMA